MLHKRSLLHLLFSSILILSSAMGQDFSPIDIPFEVQDKQLDNALIGGLIAPQFVSFDLDGQGAEDLIVFDRLGDVLLPFINNSTPGNPNYKYAPEYTEGFPQGINYLKLKDYNGDGKKDMFTLPLGISGVEVYKNTSEGGNISFELVEFNHAGSLGNALQVRAGGGFTQIYVANIDIPEIIDVDDDGDLDILNFDSGGSVMWMYQNMVVEMGLQADTFAYQIADFCWGEFIESGIGEEISLSDDPDRCATEFQGGDEVSQRHSGSTVLAYDGDGDGDLDMLLGDLSNDGLVYLTNSRTSVEGYMTSQDTEFPSNDEAVDIFVFLGAFFLDIDNDGNRDLIVAPNNAIGAQNVNHVWYYHNDGADDSPIFSLVQKDFLVGSTVSVGRYSHPAFLDYNNDGLYDIVIGNDKQIDENDDTKTGLVLYENVGTSEAPAYVMIDDDYLDLSLVLPSSIGFLSPTIGDLDSDGDDDLVIAESRGQLFYFENVAGVDQPYEFAPYIYKYQDIRVGNNGRPAIFDMDFDGLNDLIIGEKNSTTDPVSGAFGGLNFLKNYGSEGNPIFYKNLDTLDNTQTLGDVYTGSSLQVTPGQTAPSFLVTEDGPILSVGSGSGEIHIYQELEGNIEGQFDELYARLPILNSGAVTSTTYADIDNDGFFEVLVGNSRGGLMAFNTIFETAEGPTSADDKDQNLLKIYPNPAEDVIQLVRKGEGRSNFEVLTVGGQVVQNGDVAERIATIYIKDLPVGMYLLKIDGTITKFVKL